EKNPFFALMLGGLWLALPWFVFNGIALGSATRVREWIALAVAAAGTFLLATVLIALNESGVLEGTSLRLAALSMVALKLGMGYAVVILQTRGFEIWQYFGGAPRNGVLVVVLGMLATPFVLGPLQGSIYWLVLE
ncbi:hypothetical protein N790_10670, partial [Arenimonas malthae CC-JY-1]